MRILHTRICPGQRLSPVMAFLLLLVGSLATVRAEGEASRLPRSAWGSNATLWGDVNNNGLVNQEDAAFLAAMLAANGLATDRGDLTADGRVDVIDLCLLETFLVPGVTDVDGNVYTTVRIGDQVWMAESLRTTRFHDGEPIPYVTGNAAWANLTTAGYCWGTYNPAYRLLYGPWYNWQAVSTGRLAPRGWHVPTVAEWETLAAYLGGARVAGGKMKVPGTDHWFWPNTGATNESGFSGYPVGYRNYDGVDFNMPGDLVSFWTANEADEDTAFGARLLADSQALHIYDYGTSKNYGYSIRCVKDIPVPTTKPSVEGEQGFANTEMPERRGK